MQFSFEEKIFSKGPKIFPHNWSVMNMCIISYEHLQSSMSNHVNTIKELRLIRSFFVKYHKNISFCFSHYTESKDLIQQVKLFSYAEAQIVYSM